MRLQYSDIFVPQATPVGSSQGRAPVQPVPVGNFGETPETAITQGIVNLGQNLIPVLDKVRESKDRLELMTLNTDKDLQTQRALNILNEHFNITSNALNDKSQRPRLYRNLYENNQIPSTTKLFGAIKSSNKQKVDKIVEQLSVSDDEYQNGIFKDSLRETLLSHTLEAESRVQAFLFKEQTEEHSKILDEYTSQSQIIFASEKASNSEKDFRLENLKRRLDQAVEFGTYSPPFAFSKLSSAINSTIYAQAQKDLINDPVDFMEKLRNGWYSRNVSLEKNGSKMLIVARTIFGKNAKGFVASLDPAQIGALLSTAVPAIKADEKLAAKDRDALVQEGQTIQLYHSSKITPQSTISAIKRELEHREKFAKTGKLEYSGGKYERVDSTILMGTLDALEKDVDKSGELTTEEQRYFSAVYGESLLDAYKTGNTPTLLKHGPEFAKIVDRYDVPEVRDFWETAYFVAGLGARNRSILGFSENSTIANGAKLHTDDQIRKYKKDAEVEFNNLSLKNKGKARPYMDLYFKDLDTYLDTPIPERAAKVIKDDDFLPNEENRAIAYINAQHTMLGKPPVSDLVDLQRVHGVQALTPELVESFANYPVSTPADLQRLYRDIFAYSGHSFSNDAAFDPRDVPDDAKEIAVLAFNDLLQHKDFALSPLKANILLNPAINASNLADVSLNSQFILEAKSNNALVRATTLRGKVYDKLQENGISFVPGEEDNKSQKERIDLLLYVAARIRAEKEGLSSTDIEDWEEKTKSGNFQTSFFGPNPDEYIQQAIDYVYNSRFVPAPPRANGKTELLSKVELTRSHGLFPNDPSDARQVTATGLDALRIVVSSMLMDGEQFKGDVDKNVKKIIRRSMPEAVYSKIERGIGELALKISKKLGQNVVLNKDDYQIDFIQNSTGTGLYAAVYLKDPHLGGAAQRQFIISDSDGKNIEFEYGAIPRMAYMGDRYSVINDLEGVALGVERSNILLQAVQDIVYSKDEDSLMGKIIKEFKSDKEINYIGLLEEFVSTNGFEIAGARINDIRNEGFGLESFILTNYDQDLARQNLEDIIQSSDLDSDSVYEQNESLPIDNFYNILNRFFTVAPNAFRGRVSREAVREFIAFSFERMGSKEAAYKMSREKFLELRNEFLRSNLVVQDNVLVKLRTLNGKIGVPSELIQGVQKQDNAIMQRVEQ
jgi:hypothetical protein